jgi:hypothetical protein
MRFYALRYSRIEALIAIRALLTKAAALYGKASKQRHLTPVYQNTCRAFLDPYAQFSRFSDGAGGLDLEEFLDAKDVVTSLSKEYEACERADYVSSTAYCNT